MRNQDKRIALALGLAPIGGVIGLATATLVINVITRRKKKKQPLKPGVSAAKYNDHVADYNAMVTRVNVKILEAGFENVPGLKFLIDMLDQEAFDEAFESLMTENW